MNSNRSLSNLKFKLILPALLEAKSPDWRPIKYSLFPPLGLATLAAFIPNECETEIIDEHVEAIDLNDYPDVVVIQIYITNAYRAYQIADHYRNRGSLVLLGGLHVTSLPQEAALHADVIFLGPGEDSFPRFLDDLKNGSIKKVYHSENRSLLNLPFPRRDLIKKQLYLVPNSITISRGCPHQCTFCYKHAFFAGGKSYYRLELERALAEISGLKGKHLFFLDDHLLASAPFTANLFDEMKGMGKVFQGAATVESVMDDNLLKKAHDAGLRSLFIGFETMNSSNLQSANKNHNKLERYDLAIRKLHDMGIMINGSFVYGFDEDDSDVFKRTVDWAVSKGITTATFHILTPYPGTKVFEQMLNENRILTTNWNQYNTRQVVFKPNKLSPEALKAGYDWSYTEFYKWSNIFQSARQQEPFMELARHLAYSVAWKKMEPLWNYAIKLKQLNRALPLLVNVLNQKKQNSNRFSNPLIIEKRDLLRA